MNSEKVSQWIETITRSTPSDDLLEGKKEYMKWSGELFQDDKSYESRIGVFLEWYVFERRLPGADVTPVEHYIRENETSLNPEELEFLKTLGLSIHSLFFLNKIGKDRVVVTELFENLKYQVIENQQQFPFNKRDIFEGRLVPLAGNPFFTGNFTYHPSEANSFIQKKIKETLAFEKKAHQELKALEKSQVKATKELEDCNKRLDKLRKKLELATRESKQLKLQKEIKSLQELKVTLETRHQESSKILDDFRQETIQTRIPMQRFELIQKLSYMSLKWERSRQIDLFDIYKD